MQSRGGSHGRLVSAGTNSLVRAADDRHERRGAVLHRRRRLDDGAVRGLAAALRHVDARGQRACRRRDAAPRRDELPAALGHVRRRPDARGRRGPDRAAGGQRVVAGHRRADGRPHAHDEGSAGRGVLDLRARLAAAATGRRAADRRRLLARAVHDRRRGGPEVLHDALRLAADRIDGHGRDGQVPHVRPDVPARRHDEQAADRWRRCRRTGGCTSA